MSKKTKYFLILFLILWIGITVYLSAQEEGGAGFPCYLTGKVAYKGASAFDGLKVEAIIEEKSFAEAYTKDGQYQMSIPPDSAFTEYKEGWVAGEVIYFKVNGFPASQTFSAKGGIYTLNLSVASSDVKLTTWGKIKALFK
jgi:hypothetical protein